jgi:hypothetical protein
LPDVLGTKGIAVVCASHAMCGLPDRSTDPKAKADVEVPEENFKAQSFRGTAWGCILTVFKK